MSEWQFTPGPWDWWDDGERVRVTEAAEQGQICEVTFPSDARLIAAAPELYEALAELLRERGAYDGSKPAEWITAGEERGIEALAKVRGRSAMEKE